MIKNKVYSVYEAVGTKCATWDQMYLFNRPWEVTLGGEAPMEVLKARFHNRLV